MEIFAKRIISVLLCVLTLCFIGGCKPQKQRFEKVYIDYFDTVITVIGYEYDEKTFNSVCDGIEIKLDKYHKLFDIYNTYDGVNNLCFINKKAGKEVVKTQEEIISFLLYCKQMYTLTEGSTNVALGGVLSIWHSYRTNAQSIPENASVPEYTKLFEASKHCNIDDIIINTEESTVYIKDEKLSIDAGAVAKGYALKLISDELNIDGYAINMGGMVKTFGKRADGSDWSVGIENPEDRSKTELAVTPKNLTVVTSGSYQRFYEVDGVRYHHIINPKTLMPENDYLSVTVLTEDSALGDVLSTALFNMSIEDAEIMLSKLSDEVNVMWILNDGKKEYYGKFKDYIY